MIHQKVDWCTAYSHDSQIRRKRGQFSGNLSMMSLLDYKSDEMMIPCDTSFVHVFGTYLSVIAQSNTCDGEEGSVLSCTSRS